MRTHNKDSQSTTTPENALSYLREGNARFVNNLKANRNLLEQVNETRAGQWPFATILSCIDSRTSAELVFDQGLGDIFSIRLAGNVLAEAVLGSMEFACKVAGSKLLVVLGHTSCGAIKGACDQIQLGNLSTLLNMIQPSVYYERTVTENRTSSNPEFVDRVARIQVLRTVEGVIERSMVLREMVEQGEIGLVGAMYDVATGTVDFIEESWMCGHIRHFYVDSSIVGTSARKEEAMAARRAAPRPAVAEIAAVPQAQPELQPQVQAASQPQVPPQPQPRPRGDGRMSRCRPSARALRALVPLLLVLTAWPVAAQDTSEAQLWVQALALGRLSEHWRSHLEVQPRVMDDVSELGLTIVRTAVGYQVSPRASVWLGHAWVPRTLGAGVQHEQRVWQQLLLTGPAPAGWGTSLRVRLEQRWLEPWRDTSHRLRLLTRAQRPLGTTGTWSLAAYDELMLTLDETGLGPERGYDRNRLYGGVMRRVSPWLVAEAGYIWERSALPAARRRNDHVVIGVFTIAAPQW